MTDGERIGPYRIIQRLGVGGMGEVVLAHDDRLDRLVAIKRLHDDRAATPHSRERFRREARIAARLNHPAIVQIYDVLHEGDQDYLIMEYVEGQTLRARRAAGVIAAPELLTIAHQIALGMAVAHDLGVIHRDLKAENILLTRARRAKITDFGIAKVPGEDTVTAEGAVVGTFRAMSPEQALGRVIDHRSDLFSFGILLYEALTGDSPFRAETPYLTVQRLVLDEPRPIAELAPDIPPALASLIHQLLAKEPMLRPRHFHEVADALIGLAGEVCEGDCHGGGATFGESVGGSGDHRPTEDGEAPAPPPIDERPSEPSTHGELRPPPVPDHHPPTARTVRRRARWTAALGAAIAGALCIGYAVHGVGSSSPAPARVPLVRVAVLSPTISGSDPEVALLAVAVRNAVISDIRAREGLALIPRADIDSYTDGVTRETGHPPEQRAIRAAVGADEVIASELQCVRDSCRVTFERNTGDSAGPPAESFQLATDTAAHPGATITAHLSRLYPDHPAHDTTGATSIDPNDQAHFLRLVQDYWHRPRIDVLDEIEQIRARSPRSIDVLLFEADVLRHRYQQTENLAEAQHSMALLGEADRLFPDTYDIVSARFEIELTAHRLDDASATLDRLATLDPDSRTTHLQRAKLARARGHLDQALRELDAAAQREVFSWSVSFYRVVVFEDLGDHDRMHAALAQLLARSPGNYAGLSTLAAEEQKAGRPACAEQIYAQLIDRAPLYYECTHLGWVRSQLGHYRDAVAGFRCALDIRPDDLSTRLDLAESLLLAGDHAAADEQLHTLYQRLDRRRRDAPTGTLDATERLIEAQTLAYLGRSDAAMAAEARARVASLMTAVRGRSALHTAAVVHAVLGDRELAAKYVTEYLDAGNSPSNLSLPWFDSLRRDPVLGPRLAVPAPATTCESTTSHK